MNLMDSVVAILERIIGRMPGPGKVMFGALTEDRRALQVLVACMLAVLGTYLQPPILSLYSPFIQRGLRDPGSGVPLLVAAWYLILAVLTLVGGASGDIFGRKRFILVGLGVVLASNIVGLFTFDSTTYLWVNTLNSIAAILVLPMSVAIVTLAFPIHVRPFAYGALFGTQGVAMVLSSSFLAIAEAFHLEWLAFVPAIASVLVAIRLVHRDVTESHAPKSTSRRELVLNVVWAAAIFSLVYGLLAFGGGPTERNLFLIIAICVLGFIIGYRWLMHRYRGSTLQLYNVRDLSFAILAGIVLGTAQASFFYQISPFFQTIQGLGAVQAGIRLVPYILAIMIATLVIVRLSLRFGARRLISGGLVILAIGMGCLYFIQPDTSYWLLVVPMLVMGFGVGIATVARTVVVLTAPPPGLTGMAAGINSAASQSGFTLGIIVSSALVTIFAGQHFVQTLEQTKAPPGVIQVASDAFQNLFARAMTAGYDRLPTSLEGIATTPFDQAFTVGLGQMYLVTAILIALAAAVIFIGMSKGLQGSLAVPLNQKHPREKMPSPQADSEPTA